jgi:hypothetical protein
MGRSFVSLGDDASSIFLNSAGIVAIGAAAVYGEYTNGAGSDITGIGRACAVLPAGPFTAAAGYYRLGRRDGDVRDLFVAGIARTLLEGTQGSFLSIGAALRVGRILSDSACGPCGGRSSESAVAGDIGVMLRPLPILSLAYACENARNARFEERGHSWPRVQRWGVSYFWESSVVISFAQEHAEDRTVRQYGFSVRTALPVELMGGFSDGSAAGGIRVIIDRFRGTIAFTSGGRNGAEVRASLEILLRGGGGGEAR